MDRDKFIMDNLQEKYDYLVNKGYDVCALFLQGSQNYQLDIYDDDYKSDIDAKAIVLPSIDDVVLNKQAVSTTIVMDNNEHIDVKDIRVMKETLLKSNISYVELLYTKYKIINPKYKDYIEALINNRDKIANINKNQFARCIKGMALEKEKALEHPYPTIVDKIEKYGYDPKQLHHILRLAEFAGKYLIEGKPLEECYVFDEDTREYLIDIKKGVLSLVSARIMANAGVTLISNIVDRYIKKHQPETTDKETLDWLNSWTASLIRYSFIVQLQLGIVKSTVEVKDDDTYKVKRVITAIQSMIYNGYDYKGESYMKTGRNSEFGIRAEVLLNILGEPLEDFEEEITHLVNNENKE